MANILKSNRIEAERVALSFTPELAKLITDLNAWEMLLKFFKQLDKMPSSIAKIDYRGADVFPVANSQERIATVKKLKELEKTDNRCYIHVAYEPGESYRMGTSVGKVFASNAGLILLNDVRLKQVAGTPPKAIYLINLIIHEILHIYGLAHASGLGGLVKNNPVMDLGKINYIGMSYDDKAGLSEIYNTPKGKRVILSIENIKGDYVAIINKDKKKFSQGKLVDKGNVVFPYTKPGKYLIYVNSKKVKTIMIKKDKVVKL